MAITEGVHLEEVAVNLKVLYQLDVPYRFEILPELSAVIQARTKFPIAPNKPIVGERIFTRE